MKTNYQTQRWRPFLVLAGGFAAIIFAILALKVVAISNSEKMNADAVSSSSSNNSGSLPKPIGPPRESVEAEVITILPTGFEPAQITRPTGKFLLAIENRSGIQRIDFQLSAESGSRIFQVNRTWERADWSDVVNPPPGRYVLTEANHPSWQCVITITQ